MTIANEADEARIASLAELHDQLASAVDRSERLEEFLLAAQLALALDTVRVALVRAGATLEEREETGARAG